MATIVLAGGRGRRLGHPKASKKVGAVTLLQQVVDIVASIGHEIIVVIAQDQSEPSLSGTTTRIIRDRYPDKGVLCGIYTGLMASSDAHNIIVACDMPMLNTGLLNYMLELAPGFDAVIPRVEDKIEPLHAIYGRSCLCTIRRQIERDNLRIRDFLEDVRVRYIERDELDRFDPERLSFFNINTVDDLEKAKKLLRHRRR